MDSSSFAVLVARNVQTAMTQAGLSVLALSQSTGIARVTLIRRLRFPDTSPFDVRELESLAEAFGINVITLVRPPRPAVDSADTDNSGARTRLGRSS
jgi:transcriptional regulator with XRE-family HTH domain